MAKMVAIVEAMIKKEPAITVDEIAEKLNVTRDEAAIYVMWVYYEGESDATKTEQESLPV